MSSPFLLSLLSCCYTHAGCSYHSSFPWWPVCTCCFRQSAFFFICLPYGFMALCVSSLVNMWTDSFFHPLSHCHHLCLSGVLYLVMFGSMLPSLVVTVRSFRFCPSLLMFHSFYVWNGSILFPTCITIDFWASIFTKWPKCPYLHFICSTSNLSNVSWPCWCVLQ